MASFQEICWAIGHKTHSWLYSCVAYSTHRHTMKYFTMASEFAILASIYVKSHGVYLVLYFLVFGMWLSALLAINVYILLVCALWFLYPFVFEHVYWLPYVSVAVGNSVANSVTGFAHYFCRDRTFLHMRYMQDASDSNIIINIRILYSIHSNYSSECKCVSNKHKQTLRIRV